MTRTDGAGQNLARIAARWTVIAGCVSLALSGCAGSPGSATPPASAGQAGRPAAMDPEVGRPAPAGNATGGARGARARERREAEARMLEGIEQNLVQQLSSPDLTARQAAVRYFVLHPSPEAVAGLAAALRESALADEAAVGLGRLMPSATVTGALLGLLDDPSAATRRQAVALLASDPMPVMQQLAWLARADEEAQVRREAVRALGTLCLPVLLAALNDSDEGVVREARRQLLVALVIEEAAGARPSLVDSLRELAGSEAAAAGQARTVLERASRWR